MGVIVRQGIKYTIVTYVFMLVSIAAALVLYPLDLDVFGTLAFFTDTALLVVPFILFGMTSVTVKFFPELNKTKEGGNQLISPVILVAILSTLTLSLIALPFLTRIKAHYAERSDVIALDEYLWFLVPLIAIVSIHNFLIIHTSNYKRIAFPRLIQSLYRITLPLIFVSVIFDFIEIVTGVYILILHFALAVVALLIYIAKQQRIDFGIKSKTLSFLRRDDVKIFASFAMLSTIGSGLAFKIDTFMVTSILDTTSTGLYSIGNRIGSIIAVPTAAIIGIAAPIISSAMKEKNFDEVSRLYRRSSEILTVAGVFMLSGLFVIMQDVILSMKDGDQLVAAGAIYIITLIASARFIDMITSVNSHIITLSTFYKYNLYFLLFLGVGNITLNIVLIPLIGIKGAALATFISLVFFNIIKVIFIRWKFGMWPFTLNTFRIVFIGVLAVLLVLVFDHLVHLPRLADVVVKGGLIVFILTLLFYFAKVSVDFNQVVSRVLKKVGLNRQ